MCGVFQDGPLPALIMDPEFRILQPNRKACKRLAASPAELASLALPHPAADEPTGQLPGQ